MIYLLTILNLTINYPLIRLLNNNNLIHDEATHKSINSINILFLNSENCNGNLARGQEIKNLYCWWGFIGPPDGYNVSEIGLFRENNGGSI